MVIPILQVQCHHHQQPISSVQAEIILSGQYHRCKQGTALSSVVNSTCPNTEILENIQSLVLVLSLLKLDRTYGKQSYIRLLSSVEPDRRGC